MDNTLATLGLCRRAGKLVYGFDAVIDSIRPPDGVKGKPKPGGVLIVSDLSEKTKKEVRFQCAKENVPVTELPHTLDDIKQVIGKRTGVLAVLDGGLYDSAVRSINK